MSRPIHRARSDRVRRQSIRSARVTILLFVLCFLTPIPGVGQSLLAGSGLGFRLESLDARSRGMGSLGVGLFGASLFPGDPAAAHAFTGPTATGTYQPSWNSPALGGEEGDHQAARFPVFGVAFPVGGLGGVATLTFGTFLDQRWRMERDTTLDLAGTSVPVIDRFASDGGISEVRLGWAGSVGSRLAVGVTVGSYLGTVERRSTRRFDSEAVGAPVESFERAGRWRFTGPTAAVGLQVDPSDLFRIAGSATWSGNLSAEPLDDTEGPSRDFDLPTRIVVGASAFLSSRTMVNVGASYADWSATGDDLRDDVDHGAVWRLGGGVEWEGLSMLGRPFPLRVGVRRGNLPFRFEGADPVESAFSAGLALDFLESQENFRARIDMALEVGSRDSGSFSESFTRATFAVTVGGG